MLKGDNMSMGAIILIVLLVVLNLLNFQQYAYMNASNGISAGAGAGFKLFGSQNNAKKQVAEVDGKKLCLC